MSSWLAARLLAAALLSLVLCALGCSTPDRPPQRSATARPAGLVEVNLITIPVALNLDPAPGLDSISVKLFFNDATHPKPVPFREGTLEVFLLDGLPRAEPKPLRVSNFDVAGLAPYDFTASLGTGYDLVLAWETARPTQRMVTVLARYTSPAGHTIQSAPSSINVYDSPAGRPATP